ncbi:TLD-domain-containing protein [Cladochytrium replicatum]|nr:TLD-domain-containing protein [Cladochytrium replicatum]
MGNSGSSQEHSLFDPAETDKLRSSFDWYFKDVAAPKWSDLERSLPVDLANAIAHLGGTHSASPRPLKTDKTTAAIDGTIRFEDWTFAAHHLLRSHRDSLMCPLKDAFNFDLKQTIAIMFAPGVYMDTSEITHISPRGSTRDPDPMLVDFLVATTTRKSSGIDDLFGDSMPKEDGSWEGLFSSQYCARAWDVLFESIFFKGIRFSTDAKLGRSSQKILNHELSWILKQTLGSEYPQKEWRCAFSSAVDGKSWTQMRSSTLVAKATVIIIRDAGGYIFGGFASSHWKPQPKFFGDSGSFLFTSSPKLRIYRATGVNQNFQYSQHATKTYSNGMGFGGQIDYFGLWLEAGLTNGHSKASPLSTTYGNPRLSRDEEFSIDAAEVWCVRELSEEELEELIAEQKSSVLAKNPEAQALLEMAGRRFYSKELPPEPTEGEKQ